uniref:G-protein coupled receptors family 2 profile 1 domain-containing protein n=1 Tax=Callorhinchus milii TaxID=7868 RepID=A0A4W3JKP7_CALMI
NIGISLLHKAMDLLFVSQRIMPNLASTENYADNTIEPPSVETAQNLIRQKIMDAQFKCYEKMVRDPPLISNIPGPYCNRTWDGWLCWEDTVAGTLNMQNCPDYFNDFDETEKVTKYCDDNGNWFKHPETNRTWSNYTFCNKFADYKIKVSLFPSSGICTFCHPSCHSQSPWFPTPLVHYPWLPPIA